MCTNKLALVPFKIHWAIGLMSRMFGNGPVDKDSIKGRDLPKTQKMVTQYYKVKIKGKVEQSRRSALPYNSVLYLFVIRKVYFYPRTGFYFRTCEDGAGWHFIPSRISPRSEFFSQAYKKWHIMWGINLGLDWPPLARGSKFHTIHTPTRSLSFLP